MTFVTELQWLAIALLVLEAVLVSVAGAGIVYAVHKANERRSGPRQ